MRSASLCALLSAADTVAVAVMVMVLLVTCWLAGPCTCALAASMAAVSAFMLSMLSVELDRPGWELMPPRGPEPPSMYASWADSVLLWAVMEMKGLEGVVRGGTGGGVFL